MSYNVATICNSIFNLSKTITTSKEDNIDAWKPVSYTHLYPYIKSIGTMPDSIKAISPLSKVNSHDK